MATWFTTVLVLREREREGGMFLIIIRWYVLIPQGSSVKLFFVYKQYSRWLSVSVIDREQKDSLTCESRGMTHTAYKPICEYETVSLVKG